MSWLDRWKDSTGHEPDTHVMMPFSFSKSIVLLVYIVFESLLKSREAEREASIDQLQINARVRSSGV